MKTRKILPIVAAFAVLGPAYGLLAPKEAQARKKSVLEGEPIVRKKMQLRKFRFQLTPYIGMSLSQPFVHMGYVGARVGTHFADWIGIRAGFGYGVINLDSKLLKAINGGGLPAGIAPGQPDPTGVNTTCDANAGAPCRPVGEGDNPAPLKHDFRAGLTRAQWQSSFDVVFTPFAGKLGLFSAIFTEYDIYLFGGLGLVGYNKHYKNAKSTSQLKGLGSDCLPTGGTGEPNQECLLHPVKADTGVKVGGSFGAGLNLFLGVRWVSLNLEFQDIVTRVNLAGLNNTIGDIPPRVDKNDRDTFHNVTFQLGATFYMPFKAKRSK